MKNEVPHLLKLSSYSIIITSSLQYQHQPIFPLRIAIHPPKSWNSITSSSDRSSQCKIKCISSFTSTTCTLLADPLLSPLSSPLTHFYSQLCSSSPQFHQYPPDPLTPNIYTDSSSSPSPPSALSVAPLELPNSPSLPSRYCLSTSAPSLSTASQR